MDGSLDGQPRRTFVEGVLVIDSIDRDQLEVRACGSFTSDDGALLEERLDRLVACGIRHLRIDFADTVAVEPEAGEIFLRARDRFGTVGGSLRFVNLRNELVPGLRPSSDVRARSWPGA